MPQITITRTLAEPTDTVWSRIGDWSDPNWLPGVTLVSVDGPIRVLSVPPNVTLTETLVEQTPTSFTYTTADHPLPIADYRATVSAHEVPDGTELRWTASFTPSGASEAAATEMLTQMLTAALAKA